MQLHHRLSRRSKMRFSRLLVSYRIVSGSSCVGSVGVGDRAVLPVPSGCRGCDATYLSQFFKEGLRSVGIHFILELVGYALSCIGKKKKQTETNMERRFWLK
ncbi:hypothetical protein J3F84DRAFT_381390 [Trichoderma pleuroticola]